MEMLNIGSCPYEEACVQVGTGEYAAAMRFECEQYLKVLQERYTEPEKGYFKVKSFQHDFGTYYEVVAMFDPEDEEATNWAFEAESGVDVWPEGYKQVLETNPAWVAARKI